MAGSPKGETRNASTSMAMQPSFQSGKASRRTASTDKDRTRKAAMHTAPAMQERNVEHRHSEDQRQNKGGRDDF